MEGIDKKSRFLLLWTMAVSSTVFAFVVYLTLRGLTLELGYELGKIRGEEAKLNEMERVLKLEVASYKSPDRIETIARGMLGMGEPESSNVVIPFSGRLSSSSEVSENDLSGEESRKLKMTRPRLPQTLEEKNEETLREQVALRKKELSSSKKGGGIHSDLRLIPSTIDKNATGTLIRASFSKAASKSSQTTEGGP